MKLDIRRQIAAVVMLLMALVLMVGCGTGAASTPAPEQVATEAPAEAATEAPAEVATEEPAEVATEAPAGETTEGAVPTDVSGTVRLYTSESEDLVNEMVNDFNEVYPNVTVNIFRSGTGEVTAKIQAEQQAGEIQADVLWFADIDFFRMLAEQDALLSYMPAGGERVPAEYHYQDNRYHEVRLIFNVVAYNTQLVDPAPTSWNDLIDPAHQGKVGMPSPLYSGAAFGQLGTFANMPEFGYEFYEKLEANDAGVVQGNGAVANNLASGEWEIALLVDFFARNLKADGSPIDHIWPEEGAVLIPTPISILSATPNEDASKAFLDYMYSDRAQELFVSQSYISVLPDMRAPEGAPPLEELVVIPVDVEYIGANREEIRQRFVDLFGAE